MDEIIAAIKDGRDIEKQAAAFSLLTKEDKLAVLGHISVIRSEFSGQFLGAAYPGEEDKDVLKAIRKALFRLKSAGIKVEEPKAAGEPALRKVEDAREHIGFMSNYDDAGTRVVLLILGIKKNSFIFLNAIDKFAEGLLELDTMPVDRRGLEEIINEYRRGTSQQVAFGEISPRYASFLIEEASIASGRFVEEMKQIKFFNSRLTKGVQKADDIYGLAVPENTNIVSPEAIFTHDLFASFKVTWATLDDDRKEYAGLGGSTIVLPQYMVEEKKREFVRALIAGDPLASYVPRMKRLMEDYAYLFHVMNNFSCYKGLTEYLKGTGSPQETLFRFVARSLEETEEKSQDGLIVDPYGSVRP
ncbi:MAG: hypothetical protein KBB65_08255 [Syntrophorhabdaceae bacterium]|nr:hypothetical protein [Syntrophorhabdaceae bacterium]